MARGVDPDERVGRKDRRDTRLSSLRVPRGRREAHTDQQPATHGGACGQQAAPGDRGPAIAREEIRQSIGDHDRASLERVERALAAALMPSRMRM